MTELFCLVMCLLNVFINRLWTQDELACFDNESVKCNIELSDSLSVLGVPNTPFDRNMRVEELEGILLILVVCKFQVVSSRENSVS